MNFFHFLLFFFVMGGLSGQPAGKITYSYYKDPVAAQNALNQLKKDKPDVYALHGATYEEMDRIMRQLKFELSFKEERARWRFMETVPPEDSDKAMNHRLAVIMATQNITDYYLNLKTNERLYRTNLDGALVNIKQSFKRHTWEITGNTKQFGKYLLHEARTTETFKNNNGSAVNKEVYAWYAPDIPLPYGPAGYDGLPGLILDVRFGKDQNVGYQASSIAIGDADVSIKKPKAIAVMSEEDFEQRAREMSTQQRKN